MSKISIIVPTLNEEENVANLITRIDDSFKNKKSVYEIIFIDDNSTDSTYNKIMSFANNYPVVVYLKKGVQGKAQSIQEGLEYAHYNLIAMIDGDLQYPPEAILSMLNMIKKNETDVVVANRKNAQTSLIRKIASSTFKLLIGRILFGLNVDVQSGLKVFRKEIFNKITISPEPWMFDLHFLLRARSAGWKIKGYDITFSQRVAGKAKISLLSSGISMLTSAIKLKMNHNDFVKFNKQQFKEHGAGFYHKGNRYITHNTLSNKDIAFEQVSGKQKIIIGTLLVLVLISFILNGHDVITFIIAALTLLYFADLIFNFNLIMKSLKNDPEIHITKYKLSKTKKADWPIYTILCPLYKESAVLPQFVKAMKAIDYEHDKLQIMLLLEENDEDTILAARRMHLPKYFEIVIVPHSMPKTKPKACNYGLLQARGEYVVIYDAEDIPDTKQLKKTYLAFKESKDSVICIQSKLNFYNPHQNVLTRAFTAEYSLWFNLMLTGMQHINAPIPLGGTSNHFKTNVLKELGGWDAFNVTEDADLGMRLAKRGYRTSVLDSTTLEEANSNFKNWFWQRSRWIKGYIQTYLVHTRDLKDFRVNGKRGITGIIFQLIIGGKVLSMLINPLMWILTITYFVFRASVGSTIESFFPTPILYIGVISLVAGNFLYMYYYVIGCAKQGHYDLIKYALFIPVYWLAMSAAAYYALIEFVYKPHHWRKTKHGLHLNLVKPVKVAE